MDLRLLLDVLRFGFFASFFALRGFFMPLS